MSRWRDVTVPEWLCVPLVATAVAAPAFSFDDVALFNYMNNIVAPHPLFYYNGYVHPVSQLWGYAASGLPLALQEMAYKVPPMLGVLWLAFELLQLFRSWTPRRHDAGWLMLACLAVLLAFEPALSGNLSWAMWSLYLATCVAVLRSVETGERYGVIRATAVLLGALALPLGVLLAPVMAMMALRSSDAAARVQNASLAILAVGAHVAQLIAGGPAVLRPWWLVSPQPWWEIVLATGPLAPLVLVLATLALVAASRTGPSNLERAAIYIGVATIVAYALTSRPATEGIAPRYVLAPLLTALIIGTRQWLRADRSRPMLNVVAATLVFALAFEIAQPVTRSSQADAPSVRRFLADADQFRKTCRSSEARVLSDSSASPVVLCTRRSVDSRQVGWITDFFDSAHPPSGDIDSIGEPFILVPEGL